jgi:superfamily II DNA helicase RecQ
MGTRIARRRHDHLVDGIHVERWVLADWQATHGECLCWNGEQLSRERLTEAVLSPRFRAAQTAGNLDRRSLARQQVGRNRLPIAMTTALPMTSPAAEILRRVFGYSSFRGQQAEIVDQLVSGGDALVLMPTGGGKSLCYQIPALLRAGVGVVVSPLIALMQDQVDALQLAGVRAAFLNSSLDFRALLETERRLLRGELDLIYVAPERLLSERFIGLLEQLIARQQVALFAIDEAHCVSQWGHDFRPEYIQLSQLHERFPAVPRIALTATADHLTRQEIITPPAARGGAAVRRQLRPAQHPLHDRRAQQPAPAAARLSGKPSGRSRDRLLPVAAQGR